MQAENRCLLDDLENVLQEQIGLLRKSDVRGVQRLAIKADLIVKQLACAGKFDNDQFQAKRENVIKLYKQLELTIEAGKDSIKKQIRKVQQGIKTVDKYRISI